MTAHKIDPFHAALQAVHTDRLQSASRVQVLKGRVIDLWCDGFDTLDISHELGVAESWCLHIINRWRSEQIEAGTRGAVG